MKIKVSAIVAVTAGAMLLGCSLDQSRSNEMMNYLIVLSIAFMIYEIAKWLDGLHLCQFYAKRKIVKS